MIIMGLSRKDDQTSLVITNTLVYMLTLMSDRVGNCKSQISKLSKGIFECQNQLLLRGNWIEVRFMVLRSVSGRVLRCMATKWAGIIGQSNMNNETSEQQRERYPMA